jgi:pyruvate formate lyase activating enzyme
MKAIYFTRENNKVRCQLCPHQCLIAEGKTGICRVRKNSNGVLIAENYGKLSTIHLDPIEKKPLYHFYPGSYILSVGSVGCNMQCRFCQNCEISQASVDGYKWLKEYTVSQLVNEAKFTKGNIGIAFTYNEPTVFYEYMLETAKATHELGLKNVMITNGFINPEPLNELLPYIDAFNVDLKAFSDDFYQKQTHSQLAPVKQILIQISNASKHFEITNLIIPGLNDADNEFETLVDWIYNELGAKTMLHLSKYFPRYQMAQPSTPDDLLLRFFEKACRRLDYVYLGNTGSQLPGHDTECPKCKITVIRRNGYIIDTSGVTVNGNCVNCTEHIVKNL